MNTAIRLPKDIISQAEVYAKSMNRSMAKQIEYWARIGKIAEENPDLPYSFIKDILISQQELKMGQVQPYHFEP